MMLQTRVGMKTQEQEGRGSAGRPPSRRKGEVDARILESATRLFLRHGFEGTSCDQVAADAHAGKASIYARYANKTALFHAVVDANLGRLFSGMEEQTARQGVSQPVRERLQLAATRIVEAALSADAVALLRLLVAETPRFPELRLDAERIRQRIGAQHIAAALAAGAPDDKAAATRAAPAAARFIDLALAPSLLLALLGEDPAALLAAAPARIGAAIASLHASGELDGWD